MKLKTKLLPVALILVSVLFFAGCDYPAKPRNNFNPYGPSVNYPERLSPADQEFFFESVLTNKKWIRDGVYSINDDLYTSYRSFTINPDNNTMTITRNYNYKNTDYKDVVVTYKYAMSGYYSYRIHVSLAQSEPILVSPKTLPDEIKSVIKKTEPIGFDLFYQYDWRIPELKRINSIVVFDGNHNYPFKAN